MADSPPVQTLKLSQTERMSMELEVIYKQDPVNGLFDPKFLEELRKIIDRMENWELGLLAFQIPAYVYLLSSVFSNSLDFSLFGVKISGIVGIREFLLLFQGSAGIVQGLISEAKSRRSSVHKVIIDIKYRGLQNEYFRLLNPGSFYTNLSYSLSSSALRRERLTPKLFDALLAIILLVTTVGIVAAAIVGQIAVLYSIVTHPQLRPIIEVSVVAISIGAIMSQYILKSWTTRKYSYFDLRASLALSERIKPQTNPASDR